MRDIDEHIQEFTRIWGSRPQWTGYSPGRVNIIGAHTDHNKGRVLSAALPLGTLVSIRRNGLTLMRIASDQESSMAEFPRGHISTSPALFWTRYVVGVLLEMEINEGLDIYISSDLPMQKGLASSAALTIATAEAAASLTRKRSLPEQATLCQRVEQKYVGVNCGLLDQYTAVHARAGSLLQIDCATICHDYVTFIKEIDIVVSDSGICRQLRTSPYNLRQMECQQVAAVLKKKSLRDVTVHDLCALKNLMPVAAKRAEHVLNESKRVDSLALSLRIKDYKSIGKIMMQSHQSCRDLYECSTPELDFLVNTAASLPGCIGTRLTGAGWGGATINLVLRTHTQEFCATLASSYKLRTEKTASLFVASTPAGGAFAIEH
jgi:galactokinase